MEHILHLDDEPFKKIANGTKTIEMRLNDEEKSLIKVDDTITFINRTSSKTLNVKVINIYHFPSFKELYDSFDKSLLGYDLNEIASYKDMEKYYSVDRISKYGVLGIEVKRI